MGEYAHPEALVTTAWLADHLRDPALRILDARFSGVAPLPEEYEAGHVPGAVFVDVLALRGGAVESEFRRAGVSGDRRVVIYDQGFGAWAAYVWWVLRYHGHDDVRVLDGGYQAWLAETRPVEQGPPAIEPGSFTSRLRPALRVTAEEVLAVVQHGGATIVDALPGKIFRGEALMFPTHRAGHIPGARNVSAPSNIDRATDHLLGPDELARVWSRLPVDRSRTITYCGAGPYGAFDLFALHLLGHENAALYEGSWLEWGGRPDLPVEVGPERPPEGRGPAQGASVR